jgi:hypothetical protein
MVKQHPSGRPIRRPEIKKLSIIRNPGTGPLLERLRPSGRLEEVGFHRPIKLTTEIDE